VNLFDIGNTARVVSLGPLRCVFETDVGFQLALPRFNFRSMSSLELRFDRVVPAAFQNLSPDLPKAVIDNLDCPHELLALNALSEVLPTSKFQAVDLYRRLKSQVASPSLVREK
jgi:hypothetical protein